MTDPLSMFNHTASRRDDVRRMVTSLNNVLHAQKISDSVLAARFEKFWPDLERQLDQIQINQPAADVPAPRDPDAMMAEILTVVRDTSRNLSAVSARRPQVDLANRRVRDIVMSRFSTKLRELGIPYQQMGMPVETPGGITIRLNDREIEVSIGDAADLVDGILKPVDFLKRIGI